MNRLKIDQLNNIEYCLQNLQLNDYQVFEKE